MKRHKPLFALCYLLFVGFLLAACSSRATPTSVPRSPAPTAVERPAATRTEAPTEPPPTSAATVAPTATVAPLTITYWEEEGDDGDVLLDELAQAFSKANPGIKIKRVHMSYEELRDRFQAIGTGSEAPDLVRCANDFVGPFSELGLLQPVTVTLDAKLMGAFFPGALGAATVKGTLWGIPDNYGNHLMLIYNKALVTEVPPDTDNWIAQLRRLTLPAKKQYGVVYYLNEPFWLIPWLGGFGGWPLDAKDDPSLATPAMANALQFVRDLKFTYRVIPSEANYNTAFELFKSGQAAYIIEGTWNLDRYREVGLSIGVATLPKVSKTGLYPTPMTSGKYWLFGRRTEGARLEAATEFVAYMTSAQAQTAWLEKMGRLPSNQEVAKSPRITQDPILAGSMDQLSKGRGLPPAPEYRCAWQGMSKYLEGVMSGKVAVQNAPKLMQTEADACVTELRSKTQPSN